MHMKRKMAAVLAGTLLSMLAQAAVQAAVPATEDTAAYDQLVSIQDQMDSLDVTVRETTMVPGVKDLAHKTIHIKTSGLQNLEQLKAAISIETDDGQKNQYYSGGYFYTDQSGENIKYAMKPEEMLEIMNYYIYLDLDSTRLSLLEQDEPGSYLFSATEETLGDYSDKVLEGAQEEHQIQLLAVQGTVRSEDGNITQRNLQTVYTMKSGDTPQTCTVNTRETFHNPGQTVAVELPALTGYRDKAQQPVVSITEEKRTVYATSDLNVRAQNSVTAAILGGVALGAELQETGYTSDGWTQIVYNGAVGYVTSEFVSTTKPVVTKDMSGTMYASVQVNVRDKAGTEGAILGVLSAGDSISVTGYTSNNWIRVKYQDKTGYVSADYLTWDQPVVAMGGTMYVAGAEANVRAYYSTDSAILGTLSQGAAVEVTGYTPNNWIAVSYQGGVGYIYADLLTWTQVKQPTISYITGEIEETSRITMTLLGDDGMYYLFQTGDAYVDSNSGLSNGDYVSVYYFDDNGTMTATQIHVIEEYVEVEFEDEEGGLTGTVVTSGMSTVTIACDDGETRTFDKGNAVIDCMNGLYAGLRVSGWYYYDSQSGYMLDYLEDLS